MQMGRSKKLIIAAVLAATILVGGIGGAVLADDNDEGVDPAAGFEGFLGRVCEIYQEQTGDSISPEELREAFAAAGDELRAAARESRLARLVEEGVIDEEQAEALADWWASQPDVPVKLGFGGRGGCHGMGMFRGPGGFAAPAE